MDWIASPEAWIALVSLTGLEIVLGVDNIIFISILVEPPSGAAAGASAHHRTRAGDGDAHRAPAFARVDDASSPIRCSRSTSRAFPDAT